MKVTLTRDGVPMCEVLGGEVTARICRDDGVVLAEFELVRKAFRVVRKGRNSIGFDGDYMPIELFLTGMEPQGIELLGDSLGDEPAFLRKDIEKSGESAESVSAYNVRMADRVASIIDGCIAMDRALQDIARITHDTHKGQHRAYTALSMIHGIAMRALSKVPAAAS